jgi:hypothetical protein
VLLVFFSRVRSEVALASQDEDGAVKMPAAICNP